MKCPHCNYDDFGTGDSAHACDKHVQPALPIFSPLAPVTATLDSEQTFKPITTRMRFRGLRIGSRFSYPGSDTVWIVLDPFGLGLVVREVAHDDAASIQTVCCFADTEEECSTGQVDVIVRSAAEVCRLAEARDQALAEAEDFARCYDHGTVEGNAIADAIALMRTSAT